MCAEARWGEARWGEARREARVPRRVCPAVCAHACVRGLALARRARLRCEGGELGCAAREAREAARGGGDRGAHAVSEPEPDIEP